MAGSTYGTIFQITTWGESHGPGIGVLIDGCPSGLPLSPDDIQVYLDRRKPGLSPYTTARKESDRLTILSGVFDGWTTGTPISLMINNENQRSEDYGDLAFSYRPGHADYTYDCKYGFRDYRGGGRSSGRETIGRVAAGAIAVKILQTLGIELTTFAKSIGPVTVPESDYDYSVIAENPLHMPNLAKSSEAACYLERCIYNNDSVGGIIEGRIKHIPAGIGQPVFDKLDACLAKAIMSIGAVKGVEIGDGFAAARAFGTENNDEFQNENGHICKSTNHAGGILGGISDGDELVFRAAVKPTPSVAALQQTVTVDGDDTVLSVVGRHDPIIVPRAVVVVESMAALTIVDLLFQNMSAQMDGITHFYK